MERRKYLEAIYSICGKKSFQSWSQERRNTDFSQADNDLKRFLSEREQKKRESSEQLDLLVSPTYK